MINKNHLNSEFKSEINTLQESERQNILNWAVEVRKIQQNKSLSKKAKIYDLKKLNNKQAFKNAISLSLKYSINYWKDANWAQKIGIVGLGGGLSLAGTSGGAGIAALGGAIGLPLFLVTGAGGAFIGTIIDTLVKKQK